MSRTGTTERLPVAGATAGGAVERPVGDGAERLGGSPFVSHVLGRLRPLRRPDIRL